MNLDPLRAAFRGRLHTDADSMAPYLTDWRRKWTGRALAVAQPDDAEGVTAVLRWCSEQGVAVVPQGGNTGLSGGATPDSSGRTVLLSLTRLNRIRRIDTLNNTLEVEAGATLQQVQEAAREADRLFPLSLAAQGTCTIGGNLATNAGGVQVLRYGNARELCLGLEVATPQGELWNGLRGLRKDNTGYDLRGLYIGSEGTLGVITAAVLKLFPLPAGQVVAFVAVPSPMAALALLQLAQSRLSPALTAFELMSDVCIGLVEKHVDAARLPLAERSPWYVLIEVSSSEGVAHAGTAMQGLLEVALEQGLASDAALSSSLAQQQALWGLREHISEAQGAEGKAIKHDIAVPISRIGEFVATVSEQIEREFRGTRLVVFGHLGDGNLHYNLSPSVERCGREHEAAFLALEAPLNRLVHDAVAARGGSISAEHGLGVLRRDEAVRYRSAVETRLMQAVKNALDPQGLMNPAKVLA